jgi:hypothetical protein
MATNHRTARGLPIDIDRLRLANESTIAVGNMKVNARGDQLGQGGKVIKTRAQIMNEKNKLHGQLANDFEVLESADTIVEEAVSESQKQTAPVLQPTITHDTPVVESSDTPAYIKPRGSFADSVAKETEVTQELLDPSVIGLGNKSQPNGPQRL